MIEARVVRSIEVIIHEHICPLPDLPAIRPRPARSVKRLQERDRKARLDYCGVLDVTLIVPSKGALEIITKGKLDGARSRDPAIYLPRHASINRSGSFGGVDCDVLQTDGGTRTAAITR